MKSHVVMKYLRISPTKLEKEKLRLKQNSSMKSHVFMKYLRISPTKLEKEK